jgi:hypothetical protein
MLQFFTKEELLGMIKAGWREDLQDAIDDYIKTKEAEETPSWDTPKESLLQQPLKKSDSRLTSLTSNRSKSKAR